VTVWALVVPQAIAYADIAGLPPIVGLSAAAAGMFGYAVLGTSRQLIVSPTSSTAAISASLVTAIALGDAARTGALSSALAICVGLVFVVLGLARIGFISRFIPTGVQVGFMFGLGLTIIVGQSAKILGVPGSEGSFVDQLVQLVGELGDTNLPTVAVGVASLAALLVLPRVAPRLPAALIVVVGAILAVALLDLAARGVQVIGTVAGGLVLPTIPAVGGHELLALVPGAIAVAVVGSAESLTVAQQFAEEHRDDIVPDQELIANGGSNVMSGLFGGFIVGGGASQSAANDRAGARSQLVSILGAALIVITAVALLPLFRDLPQAALGAIVISAVFGFLRVGELQRIRSLRTDSFVIAIFTLVVTLVLGILPGLITSVVLAMLFLLVHLARPSTDVLGGDVESGRWMAVTRGPTADQPPGLLVLRLEAPLLYLNAGLLRDELRAAVRRAASPPRVVIVDLSMSADLDIESMDILGRLAGQVAETGTSLWLAEVRGPVREMLARAGPRSEVSQIPIYPSLEAAVEAFDQSGGATSPAAGSTPRNRSS
jgi:high affinity sulfate transporter 1